MPGHGTVLGLRLGVSANRCALKTSLEILAAASRYLRPGWTGVRKSSPASTHPPLR